MRIIAPRITIFLFFALFCLVFSLISLLPRLLSKALNYEKTSELWSVSEEVIKTIAEWSNDLDSDLFSGQV